VAPAAFAFASAQADFSKRCAVDHAAQITPESFVRLQYRQRQLLWAESALV
jgi:hypothetical protein